MNKNKTKLTAILVIMILIVVGVFYFIFREEPKFSPPTGFLRGDANFDGAADLSDPVFILNYLFRGGPSSECGDAADTNDDGSVDLSDAIFLLSYLFQNGQVPPNPYPEIGFDMTPDQFLCGDSLTDNICGFGRVNQQCICKDQILSGQEDEYCCFNNPQTTHCSNIKIYSQLKTAPSQQSDVWACVLRDSGEGCDTYDSKIQLTRSSLNQINPSYLWLTIPREFETEERGIITWEEEGNIFWCDLTESADCENNKILVGQGFNPTTSSHQGRAYIVWEKEDSPSHYIFACDLTKEREEEYSCFEGSNKIIIREREISDIDYHVIANPILKYGYVLYREKQLNLENSEFLYELHLCQIIENSCRPLFSVPRDRIDLPQSGDISLTGGILYASKNGELYNMFYAEQNKKTITVQENVNIVATPQVISFTRSNEENLDYALWKEASAGIKNRIEIKLIKEDEKGDLPAMYKVITPGYTEASNLFLLCDNPSELCIVGEKIIGALENSDRPDILDGNFINRLYVCDITSLAGYPDEITSDCLEYA